MKNKVKRISYRYKRNLNTRRGKPSKKLKRLQLSIVLILISSISYSVAISEYGKLASGTWVFERYYPIYRQPLSDSTESKTQAGENDEVASATPLGSVEEKIKKAFGDDYRVALAVAMAESGINPKAIGDGHLKFEYQGEVMGQSCGVFQIRILPGRPSCEELLDEDKNIQYAKDLYEKAGWMPWSAYKNGSYLTYLK